MKERYSKMITGLKGLGIGTSPNRYSFIRYYPPLDELPEATQPVSLDLGDLRGKIAVFIYIPFCTGACSYCFYPKKIGGSEATVDRYLDSLERQIAMTTGSMHDREAASVYIGGGTPTYLDIRQMRRLLGTIDRHFDINGPITFESSPETLDKEKISFLKSAKVDRISMGVQSLDDRILRKIGRRYDSEQAMEKASLLDKSGIIYNLDFIYGLDRQTESDIEDCLGLVAGLRPPSVTFYQRWSSMKDTYAGREDKDDDSTQTGFILDMKDMISDTFARLGYGRDSLFRFVQQEKDGCSYCKTVWEDNSCLAFGPSAYSYMDGLALQNIRNIPAFQQATYQGLLPIGRMKRLEPQERAARALLLGLKTAGIGSCRMDTAIIEKRYKVSIDKGLEELLGSLKQIGAISGEGTRISFTEEGAAFSESLLSKMMSIKMFL